MALRPCPLQGGGGVVDGKGEGVSDNLINLFRAEEAVERWRAERENASARLKLAEMRKNIALLISRYEPVYSTGIDRKKLQHLLAFIEHGDLKRLAREQEAT